MAMSVGNAGGGVMCDINTTPLIDVMLVLLVTLIVSLPIMTHAVKLDMPQSNNPPPPDQRPEVIDLEIDFDGTVVWNGTPVQSINQQDLPVIIGVVIIASTAVVVANIVVDAFYAVLDPRVRLH